MRTMVTIRLTGLPIYLRSNLFVATVCLLSGNPSQAADRRCGVNRGLIGTIIGVLVVIILVIVILQLT